VRIDTACGRIRNVEWRYPVANATASSSPMEIPTCAPIGHRVIASCPADRTSSRSRTGNATHRPETALARLLTMRRDTTRAAPKNHNREP
jgi:hypothetical protein